MDIFFQARDQIKIILDFIYNNIFWFHLGSLFVSALFIAGIIYSIIKSPYINIKIEGYMDILGMKTLSRRRARQAWQQILLRTQKGTSSNLKAAILEADRIFDEILKLSGFYGESMDERLKKASMEQIPNLEDIKDSHRIAVRIGSDPDFTIDRKTVIETLKPYEKLFAEFGIVD